MTTSLDRPADDLKSLLTRATPALTAVASKHIDADRLVRLALVARQSVPKLAQCSAQSLLLSLMKAAEIGLEPNTALDHAYLIPRFNKRTQQLEASFDISYKGWLVLAHRSRLVQSITAEVRHENDEFAIALGTDPRIYHVPDYDNRGMPLGAYAVARLANGATPFKYMSHDEINDVRERFASDTGDSPWRTDTMAMWRKTVIKRLIKSLPIEERAFGNALTAEDESEPSTEQMVLMHEVLGEPEAKNGGDKDSSLGFPGR